MLLPFYVDYGIDFAWVWWQVDPLFGIVYVNALSVAGVGFYRVWWVFKLAGASQSLFGEGCLPCSLNFFVVFVSVERLLDFTF